ncbi:MAG: LamG domain-containing protein, partial [Alphaproteobacteria bacterium]|nr:LamG domain-containing protein [Alphaproteobacteria bacterium]
PGYGCTQAGDVVYNSGHGMLQYCDGSKWVAIGADCAAVTSGLVAHLKLDEASGTSAADSSGYGNAGTLANMAGTEWTSGVLDGALQFDGTDDYISIAHDPSLNFGTGDFSIGGWVNGNYSLVLDEYPKLYDKIDSSGTEFGFGVWISGSNDEDYPSCEWIVSGNWYFASATGVSVRDGNWHHIMCVRNGSDLDIYVDGQLRGTYAGATQSIDTAVDATIGYSVAWDSDAYTGLIDDVRIYNRALSPAEVETLYSAYTPDFNCGDVTSGMTVDSNTTTPGTALGTSLEDATEPGTFEMNITFEAGAYGVILESGGTGTGMAIWADGNDLYFGVGDGGVTTTTDDSIVISYPLSPLVGRTVDLVAASDPTTGASAKLYINGCVVASGVTTGGGPLRNNEWGGTNVAGYGVVGGSGIRAGTAASTLTNATLNSNLLFYENELPANY